MIEEEPLEFVRGSGNVFRDFDYPDAHLLQEKALMGSEIIKILYHEGLSTRQTQEKTGISHSDFSRIRRASFNRFTLDRLMTILILLGQDVKVSVSVRPHGKDKAFVGSGHL